MTDTPESGRPIDGGVPWICETCGHFIVLCDGRETTESVCRDTDGPHRLTAYTGTEMAIAVSDGRDERLSNGAR